MMNRKHSQNQDGLCLPADGTPSSCKQDQDPQARLKRKYLASTSVSTQAILTKHKASQTLPEDTQDIGHSFKDVSTQYMEYESDEDLSTVDSSESCSNNQFVRDESTQYEEFDQDEPEERTHTATQTNELGSSTENEVMKEKDHHNPKKQRKCFLNWPRIVVAANTTPQKVTPTKHETSEEKYILAKADQSTNTAENDLRKHVMSQTEMLENPDKKFKRKDTVPAKLNQNRYQNNSTNTDPETTTTKFLTDHQYTVSSPQNCPNCSRLPQLSKKLNLLQSQFERQEQYVKQLQATVKFLESQQDSKSYKDAGTQGKPLQVTAFTQSDGQDVRSGSSKESLLPQCEMKQKAASIQNCSEIKKCQVDNLFGELIRMFIKPKYTETANVVEDTTNPTTSTQTSEPNCFSKSLTLSQLPKVPSCLCQFCRDQNLPVLKRMIHPLLHLLGTRCFNDVVLTVLLKADHIYHVNVRELETGNVLGCLLVNDQAIEEAISADIFKDILTFCVIDEHSTINPRKCDFGIPLPRQQGGITQFSKDSKIFEFATKVLGLPKEYVNRMLSVKLAKQGSHYSLQTSSQSLERTETLGQSQSYQKRITAGYDRTLGTSLTITTLKEQLVVINMEKQI